MDKQVNLRLTDADLALFDRASERLWPRSQMPRAATIRQLARLYAEQVLGKKKPRK